MEDNNPFLPVKQVLDLFLGGCEKTSDEMSNIDIGVTVGEFEPRAHLKLSYSSSSYIATDMRNDANAGQNDFVLMFTLNIGNEADENQLAETIKGMVNPILGNLPIPLKFSTSGGYEDGSRVLKLIITLESKEGVSESISKTLDLAKIEDGDILSILSSHTTSDTISSTNQSKFSAKFKLNASRDFVQSVLKTAAQLTQTPDTDDGLLMGLAVMSGFKKLQFAMEFDKVEDALSKILPKVFSQDDDWTLNWEELKQGAVSPLIISSLLKLARTPEDFDATDAEQIRAVLPPFYQVFRSQLEGIHSLKLLIGNHILSLNFGGFNVVKDLFPDVSEGSEDIKKMLEYEENEGGLKLKGLMPAKECRVLLIGLDAGGKTTLLYKLKLGEVVTTIPTIGFNCETINYSGIEFCFWDVGGQEKIRPLWRHYYQNTTGIVYVVDSNDSGRIEEAGRELKKILEEDEMKNIALLVFVNKMDLPNAMTVAQVTEALDLNSLRDRKWFAVGSCAVTGDGLYEGLQWLANQVKGVK